MDKTESGWFDFSKFVDRMNSVCISEFLLTTSIIDTGRENVPLRSVFRGSYLRVCPNQISRYNLFGELRNGEGSLFVGTLICERGIVDTSTGVDGNGVSYEQFKLSFGKEIPLREAARHFESDKILAYSNIPKGGIDLVIEAPYGEMGGGIPVVTRKNKVPFGWVKGIIAWRGFGKRMTDWVTREPRALRDVFPDKCFFSQGYFDYLKSFKKS